MYNAHASQEQPLHALLLERTRAFARDASIHEPSSLLAFKRRWEPSPADKLLDGLPSCPFVGLLDWAFDHPDLAQGRVGCLVHPTRHGGVDGRDCGVYDRHICEDYLCAAHSLLKEEERLLILDAVQDSYLYGLVITDVRFVRTLLELAADQLGAWPSPRRLAHPQVVRAAADYFELKRRWPYRASDGILGAVIPLSGLQTRRRPTPAQDLDAAPHPVDAALACLGTHVEDEAQLHHARQLVMTRVARFAQALEDARVGHQTPGHEDPRHGA